MLTPASLERVSPAYRRGYYDGYQAVDKSTVFCGPFSAHDYDAGYVAGENDRRVNEELSAKWSKK